MVAVRVGGYVRVGIVRGLSRRSFSLFERIFLRARCGLFSFQRFIQCRCHRHFGGYSMIYWGLRSILCWNYLVLGFPSPACIYWYISRTISFLVLVLFIIFVVMEALFCSSTLDYINNPKPRRPPLGFGVVVV